MGFTLGYFVGILNAVLIAVILTYFRRVIEHKISIIEKQIDIKGPRPEGFIIEPSSEAEESRERIIAENRKKGLDTPISELQ